MIPLNGAVPSATGSGSFFSFPWEEHGVDDALPPLAALEVEARDPFLLQRCSLPPLGPWSDGSDHSVLCFNGAIREQQICFSLMLSCFVSYFCLVHWWEVSFPHPHSGPLS